MPASRSYSEQICHNNEKKNENENPFRPSSFQIGYFVCLFDFGSDFSSDFESDFGSDFESDFGSDNLISLSYLMSVFIANLFGLFSIYFWGIYSWPQVKNISAIRIILFCQCQKMFM